MIIKKRARWILIGIHWNLGQQRIRQTANGSSSPFGSGGFFSRPRTWWILVEPIRVYVEPHTLIIDGLFADPQQ